MAQWITADSVHHYNPRPFKSGADLYGEEIVTHQRQHWDALYGDDTVINVRLVLPKLIAPLKPHKLFIQYLHTFPRQNTLGDAVATARWAEAPVAFIVAYRALCDMLNAAGHRAVYVPMSISETPEPVEQRNGRAVWFGHTYSDKGETFRTVKNEFLRQGIPFDCISKDKFNGSEPVTRAQALARIRCYSYGIGVGRCAQEMYAMGLKVLIAGSAIGGLVMRQEDEAVQMASNYNGRVVTFSNNLSECVKYLPQSIVAKPNRIWSMNHAELFRNG